MGVEPLIQHLARYIAKQCVAEISTEESEAEAEGPQPEWEALVVLVLGRRYANARAI